MNAWTAGSLALFALALAGCATLNGPEAYANAQAQKSECKAVTIYTASQEVRMQNQKGVDGNEMQKTAGVLDVGHVQLNEPKILSDPVAPGNSILNQVRRDC